MVALGKPMHIYYRHIKACTVSTCTFHAPAMTKMLLTIFFIDLVVHMLGLMGKTTKRMQPDKVLATRPFCR